MGFRLATDGLPNFAAMGEFIPQLNWIEMGAMVSLVAYVILATRESRWCWPVSIIGVVLYTIQAVKVELYGEIPLQFYYIGVSIYGWFAWKKMDEHRSTNSSKTKTHDPGSSVLRISWMNGRQIAIAAFIGIIGTFLYGYFLDHIVQVLEGVGITNAGAYINPSAYPYPDAFTTSFSFIGTYLQARKKIENWILWLIVDGVYVAIWGLRESYFFSALNILYLLLATYGLWQWYKSWKREST